jgi:hypothetical protein
MQNKYISALHVDGHDIVVIVAVDFLRIDDALDAFIK